MITQGSSSTVNLVSILPKLEAAGVNVRVIAAISEELFDRQPEAYRHAVLPPEARYDLMVVSTGTRRVWPLHDVGPLTDEYSMTSDWDHQWLTGGLEPDVIAEAHLDAGVDPGRHHAVRARARQPHGASARSADETGLIDRSHPIACTSAPRRAAGADCEGSGEVRRSCGGRLMSADRPTSGAWGGKQAGDGGPKWSPSCTPGSPHTAL